MRILVVGLGSMGRRRLRNLTHIGAGELAGLEPVAERRAAVEVPTFATLDEALAWDPDALVVSTPPDRHTEFALEAARRGIHFFTEASVVPGDTDELFEAAASKPQIVAAPSCTMRFHPAVQTIRERIAAGAIGTPLAVTHHVGQYLPDWHPWEDYRAFYVARRETGAAREIVPFELNWLAYLFGAPRAVAGMRAKLSALEADIDDVYQALVEFESGVRLSMMIEVVSRPAIRQARIVGSEGTLIWDWDGRVVREYRGSELAAEHPDPPPVEGPGGTWVAENMYIEEMRGYLRAIADGAEHWPLSLAEDRLLLDTLALIEQSSDEGRTLPVRERA